jgi:hypothetical protein
MKTMYFALLRASKGIPSTRSLARFVMPLREETSHSIQ